jgi:hypothetical protein
MENKWTMQGAAGLTDRVRYVWRRGAASVTWEKMFGRGVRLMEYLNA